MLDFVGRKGWYFLLSALIILPGIIFLILFRLEPGIDFRGGSIINISFSEEVTEDELRAELFSLGHPEAVVKSTKEGPFLLRTGHLGGEAAGLVEALENRFGPALSEPEVADVSQEVAGERVLYAVYALIAASVGILLYISWAFRRVPKPFRYGVCAVVALAHDVLVVLGVFSILGQVVGTEVNAMFITGVLTVIGYSVHDTIVVFDRIRENMAKAGGAPFETTVNNSILETLGRSLNTSLTLLFVLVALLFFGGVTIRDFILVLIIGIISGTYSSICIASQLLVVWESGGMGRLWRLRPLRQLKRIEP